MAFEFEARQKLFQNTLISEIQVVVNCTYLTCQTHVPNSNKSKNEHYNKRNTNDGFTVEASIIAFPKTELCLGFEFSSSCLSFSTTSASVP